MSSPYQVTHLDSLERGLAWLLEKYGGYTFSHKKVFKSKVDLLEQVAKSYKNILKRSGYNTEFTLINKVRL